MRRGRAPITAAKAAGVVAAAVALLAAAGCQLKPTGDPYAGKKIFVSTCGGCHTLRRAGTAGTIGPNLDQAFAQARRDGFGTDTIRGIVHQQILYPAPGSGMPPKLVTGSKAADVAAYVAQVAGASGQDTGALANATAQTGSGPTLTAKNGSLQIDVAQAGFLFVSSKAVAMPGKLTLTSKNPQSVQHNISIQGPGGLDVQGATVGAGGVSTVSATLKKGSYTFYCSVPGHRQAGMVGTLTVR
jgi:mono/diheme cytochrome c family protein